MLNFSCLTGSKYTMTADFYRIVKTQDPDTGQVTRAWILDEAAVPVEARGLGNLRGKDSGTLETFKNAYELNDYIRVKTTKVIDESYRIVNVKTSDGSTPWTERENATQQTVFEVLGVTPVVDPFGALQEYQVLCNRAQDNSMVIMINAKTAVDSAQVNTAETSGVV